MAAKGPRVRVDSARVAGAVSLLVGILVLVGSAEAYRFFPDSRLEGVRVVGSEYAARWRPEVWAPGETLRFEVSPDPEFEATFESPEGVLPYIVEALAAWSAIATADIAWEVAGVADEPDPDDPVGRPDGTDGRNTLFVDSEADEQIGGYALIWDTFAEETGWRISECDVAFGPGYALVPEDLSPAARERYIEIRRSYAIPLLVHEFGHCLGLAHSGALPLTRRWAQRNDAEQTLVHPRDPAMSYGVEQEEAAGLAADDRIGASLLRPAPGWLDRTGTVSGSIDLDGEPAPYGHIWVLPADGDLLRDRIGAFSDRGGAFLIEGLSPGDYFVWAQPPLHQGAHPSLLAGGAATDFEDAVAGSPIRVAAGETTEVRVPVRRGRAARWPAAALPASQDDPAWKPGAWADLCPGVRVRGERPYPADGPLWFTRGVGFLRGDRFFGTTLTIETSPEAAGVVFDWAGPYRSWWWDQTSQQWRFYEVFEEGVFNLYPLSPRLDVNITGWRVEREGSLVRHSLDIAWPESTAAQLRFRLEDETCDPEPLVRCSTAGCDLRR